MENVIARRNNDGTWTIRVADFGLTYNPRTGETRVGYGTPEYTSPEYLKRKGYIEFVTEQGLEDRVKQAMSDDMFALGCLLYEVLHPGIELPWAVATGQIIRREIAYDNVKKEVIPILEVLEEQYNDQVVKEAIHTVRNTLRTWIGKTDVLMASYEFLHEVVNSEELIENGLLIDRLTELNTNLVDAERIRAFDVLEKMEKAHSKNSDVNSIKSLKEKVKNGTGNEEQFNAFLTKLSTWEEGAYVNLEAMDKGLFDKDRVDALNTLRMASSELNPVSPEKKKLAQEQPAYGLSLICAKLLDEDPKMRLTASQFKAALKIIQEKKAEEFEAELAKTTQAVSLSQPVLGAIG
jgi:serine/threonine protein kinase